MSNIFRDRDHRTVIVGPRDFDDFVRIPIKMITYIFGWTEIIFNTFFIFEILARLGELFETYTGMLVTFLILSTKFVTLKFYLYHLPTIKKLNESNLQFFSKIHSIVLKLDRHLLSSAVLLRCHYAIFP